MGAVQGSGDGPFGFGGGGGAPAAAGGLGGGGGVAGFGGTGLGLSFSSATSLKCQFSWQEPVVRRAEHVTKNWGLNHNPSTLSTAHRILAQHAPSLGKKCDYFGLHNVRLFHVREVSGLVNGQ